jgi:hypothetical protein
MEKSLCITGVASDVYRTSTAATSQQILMSVKRGGWSSSGNNTWIGKEKE